MGPLVAIPATQRTEEAKSSRLMFINRVFRRIAPEPFEAAFAKFTAAFARGAGRRGRDRRAVRRRTGVDAVHRARSVAAVARSNNLPPPRPSVLYSIDQPSCDIA